MDFLIQKETLISNFNKVGTICGKQSFQGEKVIQARSYLSYGVNSFYYPSVSTTTSLIYKMGCNQH
jgi:hypothetical protein